VPPKNPNLSETVKGIFRIFAKNKIMRYFNTSGPNIPEKHYTLRRPVLIEHGLAKVRDERYFTIWAPRQTGKSTYFRQLAGELEKEGYKVAHINFENYKDASERLFLEILTESLSAAWEIDFSPVSEIPELFARITKISDERFVLIIDEVEGINEAYFGTFLHSIRNAYHTRMNHALKSVILVGVSNITGVVGDHASPFNIADNLNVPFFTDEEVYELLGQHEAETGQLFEKSVKDKIIQITANQPGLVNGFADKLVKDYPNKPVIEYADYLKVEDWYLNKTIDKNFENIRNKAQEVRPFVETLLFTDEKIPFKIDRPAIKLLHINGVIKDDEDGNVIFWVPFYKKRLYNAFYPYTNGEQNRIERGIFADEYFDKKGNLSVEKLLSDYKSFVALRGFAPFREKDEKGNFVSIKEAAMIYSFEIYISAFITQARGKIYREALVGLGKSDMIIYVRNKEYLFETKNYAGFVQFIDGKKQLAYYAKSAGHKKAYYIVFCPSDARYPEEVKEKTETVAGVKISTFLIHYDVKTAWKHYKTDDEE
jgi:hypothetical protein